MLFLLIYTSSRVFLIATAGITLIGAWEWSRLMGIKHLLWRYVYVALIAYILFSMLFVYAPYVFFLALLAWILASVLVIRYPIASTWWSKRPFWRGLMGCLVLIPCWMALNFIRNQPAGITSLFALFILIWGADTAAYFVGRTWGKTKLAPTVSPGKSWEGLAGALVFALLWAVIILSFNPIVWSQAFSLSLLAVITVLFSVLGDLFESMLKRQVGLKDSGRILPGHGGLLDRIDSLTAAAPIFALGMVLLNHCVKNSLIMIRLV